MDTFLSISLEEYAYLCERDEWLSALEDAGVDNWEGYDFARELLRESQKKNDAESRDDIQ
jgi:hypothetical protein